MSQYPPAQSDVPYWVAFVHSHKLGPTRFGRLRQHFTNLRQAWEASAQELTNAKLEPAIVSDILALRSKLTPETAWAELEKLKLSVTTVASPDYPELLKQIFDPPPVLFYRGSLEALKKLSLAVVGTRRCTSYGLRAAEAIVTDLTHAGLTIVSGLAFGIDTAAHRTCLAAGGTTVAVLAGGLDQVYPTSNTKLAQDMVEQGGALVSEFPPGTAPLKQNFPVRNRIIAGLTRGTIVVEAAPGSGALLTARYALEANREVFAIPGSIFNEQSQGTNELIAAGAHLVSKSSDVLDAFGLDQVIRSERPQLEQPFEDFWKLLPSEPASVDELVRLAGLPTGEVVARLTVLELGGYAREVGYQRFVRIS